MKPGCEVAFSCNCAWGHGKLKTGVSFTEPICLCDGVDQCVAGTIAASSVAPTGSFGHTSSAALESVQLHLVQAADTSA